MQSPTLFLAGVALTVLGLAGSLGAEGRQKRVAMWLAKPVASTGFLLAAFAAGATATSYGRATLVALMCCWIGDVCLVSRERRAFLAGLVSFLLGHLAFAGAFYIRGLDLRISFAVALVMILPAGLIWRWLSPHVSRGMRGPVLAYVVVISLMVACGVATTWHVGGGLPLVGALAFFVSDLAVARNRFVSPGLVNRLWGLPVYYAAVLILAASVAGG